MVVAGFTFLHGDEFRSRAHSLRGTPVTLHVERGVPGRRVRPIRVGISAMARYSLHALGVTVHGPVRVRVAGRSGCDLLDAPDGILVGEAELGRICIDTNSLAWGWLVLKDPTAAAAIAAHEYVHVMQAELGCLPGGPSEEPRWLVEGMATEIGWRSIVAAGAATPSRVNRTIARGGAFDTNLEPLAATRSRPGATPSTRCGTRPPGGCWRSPLTATPPGTRGPSRWSITAAASAAARRGRSRSDAPSASRPAGSTRASNERGCGNARAEDRAAHGVSADRLRTRPGYRP